MKQFLQNDFAETSATLSANDNIQSHVVQFQPVIEQLEPDLDAARRFLNLLDPSAKKFTFQTFDDKKIKRRHLASQLHEDLTSIQEDLLELNNSGAGIFVAVQETDLKGRKAENISRVRSIYADFDDGLPDDLPLAPSIVVQSSPGKYQYYWLCDGISTIEFTEVMARLVQDHKADKGAKDLARVLRLPGFYHQKDEPFLVKLLEGSELTYAREEILAAFPAIEKKQQKITSGTKKADTSDLQEALNHIPSEDYSVWRDVGFALHHETGGSQDGYAIWVDWSQSSPKFSSEGCEKAWSSFRQDHSNPKTLGTVFHMARQNGWTGTIGTIRWVDVGSNGRPRARSQRNIIAALEYLDIKLSYDEFLSEYLAQFASALPVRLDDDCLRLLWLRVEELGCSTQKAYCYDVFFNIGKANSRNSCREYLDKLLWDGTPRLDELLTRYCGADCGEFNRTVGRKFMVAAVRRVKQPGVKFDHLLTLEGIQGVGKSSFARILAGEDWFADCVRLGDDPKIISEQTRGKWIVELPELVGIKKRETEQIKSMLTRQVDIARMAYDRTTSHSPRSFVFIGTTNADQYLTDTTGNRRFWPVKVKKIDLMALTTDRDQLWAEAVKIEATGEELWLPKHLEETAAKVQASRQFISPLESRLKDLVSDMYGIIPFEELYAGLGLDGHRTAGRKGFHGNLIERVMKSGGWRNDRIRKPKPIDLPDEHSDNRRKVFIRDAVDGKDTGTWWCYDAERKQFIRDLGIMN